MSRLDSVLGGSNGGNGNNSNAQESSSSHDFSSVIASDPSFGTSLHDLLHSSQSNSDSGGSNGGGGSSDTSDFTGLGSLGVDFSAPTVIGVSNSQDNSSASESHNHGGNGGLLNGLL